MDKDYLIQCIEEEGESSFFDFKKDIYDLRNVKEETEFIKDVLCFANGHSIGDKYIITGVKLQKDNITRDIKGITESKIQDGSDYQNLIDDNVEPSLIIDFTIIEYDGKKFGIFKIGKENIDRPYMMKKKFQDLEIGFMKMRVGQRNVNITRRELDKIYSLKNKEERSNLVLKGIVNGKISPCFKINKLEDDILNERSINWMEKKIIGLFETINKIKLEKPNKAAYNIHFFDNVEIDNSIRNEIETYAEKYKITIDDNFFNLGNLTESRLGLNYSINGTEEEKTKFKTINKLYDGIKTYYGVKELQNSFNDIYYSELLIDNIGKHFDDDIQVTLKINGRCYVSFSDFPVPNENIIGMITKDDHLDRWLKNRKNKDVNEFDIGGNYVVPPYPQGHLGTMPGEWYEPSSERLTDYYHEYINFLTNYDTVFMDDFHYIKFSIKKINPNEKVFLPSRLFFTGEIKSIDYEIVSKYNPDVKRGRIDIYKS